MIEDPSERFLFRLAALLGMPVAEVLARLSHDELVGWYAFYGLEPWGSEIEDDRFAVLLSSIKNQLNALAGGHQRIKPSQCYPPRSKIGREELEKKNRAVAANAAWAAFKAM